MKRFEAITIYSKINDLSSLINLKVELIPRLRELLHYHSEMSSSSSRSKEYCRRNSFWPFLVK